MKIKEHYIEYGKRYLAEGGKLLKEGDYVQAGEKLWGAVTQFVKVYAGQNGWKHNGHRELFKVINNISKELRDDEFNDLFASANSLHINFYEHWLTDEQVMRYANNVKKLIEKLKKLIGNK